eukprot:6131461-Alexandrium_andersonii.AAC.1
MASQKVQETNSSLMKNMQQQIDELKSMIGQAGGQAPYPTPSSTAAPALPSATPAPETPKADAEAEAVPDAKGPEKPAGEDVHMDGIE